MESWQKGEIAELKVILRAAEKGMIVNKPVITSTRYDLILDDGYRLLKAQVKWAGGSRQEVEGATSVDLRKLGYSREHRRYSEGEFDILLIYLPQIDKICAFGPEIFLSRQTLSIRFAPTKNGQAKKCVMADDFLW